MPPELNIGHRVQTWAVQGQGTDHWATWPEITDRPEMQEPCPGRRERLMGKVTGDLTLFLITKLSSPCPLELKGTPLL